MKATVSRLFGGLKVHKTPNGKVVEELWPGYHVETTGERKSTAKVNWVKISYVFNGKDQLGWVAEAACRESRGPRYATLEPELLGEPILPPPPDIDISRWEDEGGFVQNVAVAEYKLFRGVWDVVLALALPVAVMVVVLALLYYRVFW